MKGQRKLSSILDYQPWGMMYACVIQYNLRNRAEGGFTDPGENGEGLFTFEGRKHVIIADDSSQF